ncbi:MAG TPA: acetoacetate--CoA ligase [Alphaproteobacteria bacterium]|nr:acetoacetate--CoA ligase [Alphaproteobacteria bacterium]
MAEPRRRHQSRENRSEGADAPLWRPDAERIARSNLRAFMSRIEADWGVKATDYASLHRFSIEEMEKFWLSTWDFAGVIAETRGEVTIENPGKMPGVHFFPQARLNFAENLLRRRDKSPAIVFWGEDKARRTLSWAELYDAVSRLAQALEAQGVGVGDRVAGWLPNMPETVIAMLAATSLGAIWSSSSPDFGVRGVLDRFGQIKPKVLLAVDGYHYNGKTHDCLERLSEIAAGMPTLERVVVVPYASASPTLRGIRNGVPMGDFVSDYKPRDIAFRRLPFNHPIYILYSSGTTGVPKCIVHGAGGVLLTHLKEHKLHCDIRPGDRVFWFTTCGWMMWNWLVSALAAEATLLLYDGSPFYPDGNVVFDFADATGMNFFGTSAKYIDACHKAKLEPIKTHSLATVRAIGSTGSPLVPEGFDYVYNYVKKDVHLASVSGGTDIVACFVGGNPIGPVWRGEIQGPLLGLAVEVFDEDGKAVEGEKGELVCTKPFPSMPVGFWDDPGDKKYHAAYFEKFPGVWCHGDWCMVTEHGGIVIYGRSDATLKPGGVRIGTAEIYRQVEQLDEVVESIVIGQDWDGDVRVVLFVKLHDDLKLDAVLIDKIKAQIKRNTTPRHVPAKIVQVHDIPRTKSGKIVELAVRDVVHGRSVKNIEALANPEALELFKEIPELKR